MSRFSGFSRFLAAAALFAASLFLAVPALHAQLSTRATITGTVTDKTGAVVAGATVTVTNEATRVASTTQSNTDGVYIVPNLGVASYSVTIAKAGFQNYQVTGIELHPATTTTVNGNLVVGAATQSVTVQAVSSEVQTITPEVSSDIDSEEVSTLPMNGRNYQGLAVMMPGVTNLQQGSAMTTGGRSTSSQLSINGMAVSRSFYALDGVWNENTGNMSQTSVIPNPDSLEEVRVLQNNFSAQYSLMGSSVILLQTKSGSANFHAAAWEFLRNDDLNSKPYFSNTIPPYKQNIFGYNVGGPVFIPRHYNANRQKTFFFWNEQFVVLHVPNQVQSIIPTANQIAGCFSSPIKDPTTGSNFAQATTGQCAGLYQIPSQRINAGSEAYLTTLYPSPNFSATGSANNYINNQPQTTYQRDDEIKIDHNFTPKYHLLAEYLDEYQKYAQNTESPGTTPISAETDFTHNKLAQLSLTQTLSPNMVNTTSVAMNIFLLNLTLVGKTDISQVPGFKETFFYPSAFQASRTPVVSFTGGMAGQGIQAARPLPHASDLDDTFTDNWSWLKGKHYLTAGITLVWNTKRQDSGQQTNGSLSFNGSFTKPASGASQQDDSLADMLLGYVAGFTQISNMPHGIMHGFSYSPYVEDQYKATKDLTLTVGLRMYHMPLPYGVPNSETNWVAGVTAGNVYNNPYYVAANAPTVNEYTGVTNIAPGTTYSNGLLFNSGKAGGLPVNFSNKHAWYFGPDAGFAWDVFGSGKTSLRGGFGMSYTRIFTNQDCSFSCIANPPVLTSQNLSNLVFPSTAGWDITAAGGKANAVGVQSVNAADSNIQASPVASYSLGLEHQFPANIIASVTGAGSRIQHLVGTWNYNQPPPYTSGGVTYDFNPLINSNPANGNKGDSQYYYEPYLGYNGISTMSTRLWQEWNGLEVQVKHPVTKTLYVSAAYTWSKNTTNLAGNGVIDPYDLKRYHGNTESLSFPQSMALTLLYELPFYRNDRGIKGIALGGWRLNDISTFRSGTWLSPGLSESNQGLAARPDQVPGSTTSGPKTWKKNVASPEWFNKAAFVDPAYGYYGNAQTGIIRGPGQQVHNLSLFKDFNFKETNAIEFRAEAFNVFNHTNPGSPNTTLGNSNFGKITSAADPRILELALRYKF